VRFLFELKFINLISGQIFDEKGRTGTDQVEDDGSKLWLAYWRVARSVIISEHDKAFWQACQRQENRD